MYYWKSGSRCEVGFWRGCVPNLNMFKDEYECVATCIFSRRARPIDYHSYNALEYKDDDSDDNNDDEDATTVSVCKYFGETGRTQHLNIATRLKINETTSTATI